MARQMVLTICMAASIGWCMQPDTSMEMPKKPDPAAEMAKLARFVGEWPGTGEMVSPSPEEMKKYMPEDAPEPPSSFDVASTYEMTLDGQFLKSESWHDMGEGQRMTFVEYWAWDAKAGKYRTWYFSDWGEFGGGWLTSAKDGNNYRMTGNGQDAKGNKTGGSGTMTFTDKDTLEWTWNESGPEGKMEFKGTMKRKR